MKKLNLDQINIILMLISCGVAYAIPFELVLISYAFLGPAHYLTEISWLHDRDYFTGVKWVWVPLSILIAIMLLVGVLFKGAVTPVYAILCVAFSLSASLALAKNIKPRLLIFLGAISVFAGLSHFFPKFELAWAVLLPTVIHIYVFTGLFIILGALKSRNHWGFLSFIIFLACGISYAFIVPSTTMISSDFVDNNLGFFDGLVDYLVEIASFNGYLNGHSFLAFLSFAYTYHYLNWFSKTEVIKWHQMPKDRLRLIGFLYLVGISITLYDFKTGLAALTFLSVAHVVFEFPLNVVSIKMIAGSILHGKSA